MRRYLRKSARERLRDIGAARVELTEAQSGTALPESVPRRKSISAGRLPWVLAGILGLGLIAMAALFLTRPHVLPGELERFSIDTPGGGALTGYPGTFALSPDGRVLVYVLEEETGVDRLWLRAL